jgi:tripartite-type tricarboxylate transporter receptor subunit TctC
MKTTKILSIVFAFLACASTVRAEDRFPSRLITIVVPLTPGTANDILARIYAEKLTSDFGWQVVVANRPGAAGAIAGQAVATSPADGYTLIMANSGLYNVKVLNSNLRFDPMADLSGVALIGETPYVVTVAPQLGVKNLKEFVELARSKPKTLNYGSAGIGSSTHISGAYFAMMTQTELVHVPYTVSSTIIADLLGARIEAGFFPPAFVMPLLEDGRLRGLAVSADAPMTEPIKIPTSISQGFDYRLASWYGILAPAKTPKEILRTLHEAIVAVGKDPEVIAKIKSQGVQLRDEGPEALDVYIRKQMANLLPVLSNIAQASERK